jgi:hypothetical protein
MDAGHCCLTACVGIYHLIICSLFQPMHVCLPPLTLFPHRAQAEPTVLAVPARSCWTDRGKELAGDAWALNFSGNAF